MRKPIHLRGNVKEQSRMASGDEVVVHLVVRAALVTTRAGVGPYCRIAQGTHAEACFLVVAQRLPRRQIVNRLPLAGRPVTALTADALRGIELRSLQFVRNARGVAFET